MDEPMELLRSNLSRVRIPEPTNRIFKHECCLSFDTPKSEGGLFIDMNTFLAFGRDCVMWNYEKTGNALYLHIKQTKKVVSEDRPLKKPALLAIGINVGFDENKPQYEESRNIVLLPSFKTLSFPSVELPEKVRLAVDAILMAEGAERKEQVAAWVADKKQVSPHAMNLRQIDTAVIIPPSGWKCEKCDKTDNLWLNLTDGMILCGRKNWDGTGGNNHAAEHYTKTGHPLAVKLGTIRADLEAADVYSYPEDQGVLDPLLEQHLGFFGIDFSSLQKTELTTSERELDQNTNFDWNRIQESGQEMEALFGPGYTGLVNLGNSCYLASTMQVAFTTSAFKTRYYGDQRLVVAFKEAPGDPTVDLNMQLTKLGHGLLSGKYSVPTPEKDAAADTLTSKPKQEGIRPHMFKTVIAASHPEFSTMRQQDALEFFLHLLEQVERANTGNAKLDPSRSFKFGIEDRIQCSSGKVAYDKRFDYILSLNIPLHEATNKEQLETFNKLKDEMKDAGNELSTDEIVRPRVPLEACLASYYAPEEVQDFYSIALKTRTTAIKTTGLTSFPDYLVLHMRKFVLDAGWVPRKLDVYVDVPDYIDISHMRSKGLQAGEELLPESESDEEMESEQPSANEDIVSQLESMGFPHLHCQKAAINTYNAGIDQAVNWILSHMGDPDIDDPISQGSKDGAVQVDPTKVDTLVSFGFQDEIARMALMAAGGDIGKATDWILSNPNASVPSSSDTSGTRAESVGPDLPDGSGRYKLLGFVSHIGTSTQCGHYVAHIQKDGRWVIYNDEKVGASVNPPKDMGYLYFFERLKD